MVEMLLKVACSVEFFAINIYFYSLSFGERVKTMVDKHGTFFKYVLDQCVELGINPYL